MTENSIKRSGSGGNLPVRRATNDEEINAVREMLLKKRNKKSPTQDEDAIKKSIRVCSLDEKGEARCFDHYDLSSSAR